MIIISLISQLFLSVISFVRAARSLRAGKLLRLARLNRLFRVFRTFRSIKVCNFFMIGADILNEVKSLIIRICICIPISMFILSSSI